MSSDKQQHRGAHPEDRRLFATEQIPTLKVAIGELAWLLNRGYTITAALKLVGDRHRLNERQRMAVARAVCTDADKARRLATSVGPEQINAAELIVDGFNLLITIEAALSQGLILLCRDTCIRDLASVHGSYRSVQETDRAIRLIGTALTSLAPCSVQWLLDKPISNSGRLAAKLRDLAALHEWPWSVEVLFNPDTAIAAAQEIAITSDAIVLNQVGCWFNFKAYLLERFIPDAWVVDLRETG